jgi:hypothetical protein
MVERRIKRDEIMNIGAYTYTALKININPGKALLRLKGTGSRSQSERREEKGKGKREIINRLTEEHEAYIAKITTPMSPNSPQRFRRT